MPPRLPIAVLLGALALAGCAVAPPAGPSVLVLPGKDKTFAQFQQDDATCRQFASTQTGGASPAEAANNSTATSAAVGTVLGAAAGAAIGAAAGNPAAGAAIGAGSGLVLGGASGVNAGAYSAASLQQRYDMSYLQCMASNGNQVPQPSQLAGTGYPGYYSPYGPYAYAYPYPYPPYYYDPWFWGPGFVGSSFIFFGGHRDHDHDHFHHGGFHHHG